MGLSWARAYSPVTRAISHSGKTGDFNLRLMRYGYHSCPSQNRVDAAVGHFAPQASTLVNRMTAWVAGIPSGLRRRMVTELASKNRRSITQTRQIPQAKLCAKTMGPCNGSCNSHVLLLWKALLSNGSRASYEYYSRSIASWFSLNPRNRSTIVRGGGRGWRIKESTVLGTTYTHEV